VVIQKIRSRRHYSDQKQQLRKLLIKKRKSFHKISEEHKNDITHNLIYFLNKNKYLKEGNKIALYWPIGSEIDTRPSLAALNEHKIIISIASTENTNIKFRLWKPNTRLEINKLGVKINSVEIKNPDVIICPLIGFDKKLNRLGRGGGYYDKILFNNQNAVKIGFAYSIQESDSLPIEKHDISMNAIITEKSIYNKA
jgi:5-formyltetrahydrofolate cyclo-ligase